jgi:poly(3-hydroxybutyrate) depolymerase
VKDRSARTGTPRLRALLLALASLLAGCVTLGTISAEGPCLDSIQVRGTLGGVGPLRPAFSPDRAEYRVAVQSDISEVAIIPTAQRGGVSGIRVDDRPVDSGRAQPVRLSVGDNSVRVQVNGRAGQRRIYTVVLEREDIRAVVASFRKLSFTDPATGVTMGYRLFVPVGYDASKPYPLVLFLHGSGESGSDNESQLTANQGATVWAKPEEQARHACFVLAPQSPGDLLGRGGESSGQTGWTSLMSMGFADPFRPAPALEVAFRILQRVMEEYSIDRNRVYSTGLSMGGFGVFAMSVAHPDTFAAVVGICGGLDPARAAVVARTPMWIFHAAEDPVVPVRFSRDTVKALADAGGSPRYTEYPNGTCFNPTAHLSWVPAYADAQMRKWLFEQSK